MDPFTTPVIPAPPGQVTDFNTGMTDIQHKFINVYVGTLAAGTITLFLRIWTRAGLMRELWWDDYAVIGAWLMNIGFFVCCIQWMQYGFGDHLWNVSLAQLAKYAEWATPVVTTYCWAPMLTKFSILLLYLRLNKHKVFRYSIFFLMFVIFAYTIATTVIVAAGCKPTDPSKTQCINNLALAQAILNIASDFFVIVLPLPMIYTLQMPLPQKVALAALLSAGSFVVVASVIRLVIIQGLPGQIDTTWVEAETCVWSAIEINVGLMCNCLMVIKPLVLRYAGSLRTFTSQGTRGSSNSNNSSNHKGYFRSKEQSGFWVQGSLPLTTIDVHPNKAASATDSDDIIVTTTYAIDEGSNGRAKSGRSTENSMREFDTESQEELASRVRNFRI